MTNGSKAKDTAAESAVVRYLHDRAHVDARRVAFAGSTDRGDVHLGPVNRPNPVVEVRNVAGLPAEGRPSDAVLAGWMAEAEGEAQAASCRHPRVLLVKRKGTAEPGRWWCVAPGPQRVGLLAGCPCTHSLKPLARAGAHETARLP